MQKKIIALAVAGLMSGAAFAQSNVTVFGVADVYMGQKKASAAVGGTNKTGAVDSGQQAGSRVGFRGTEDLGNGLKAVFMYEFATATDAGGSTTAGLLQARQAYVGLTGNFGTVVAGRLQTPGYNIANKFASGIGGGQLTTLAGMQARVGATINQSNRLDNAIAYVSPSFNGLTATVAYSFLGETATSNQSERAFALGLDYANGPLAVSFVHHNVQAPNAVTAAGTAVTSVVNAGSGCANLITTISGMDFCGTAAANSGQKKQKENALGASYDFGIAKVTGSYQTVKDNNLTTNTVSDDARIWNLGVNVPVMGNGNVRLGYTRLNDKLAADNDAKGFSIGYVHTMSKRTSLYGGWAQIKNKNTGTAALASGGLTGGAARDNKSSSYGIGLTHSF